MIVVVVGKQPRVRGKLIYTQRQKHKSHEQHESLVSSLLWVTNTCSKLCSFNVHTTIVSNFVNRVWLLHFLHQSTRICFSIYYALCSVYLQSKSSKPKSQLDEKLFFSLWKRKTERKLCWQIETKLLLPLRQAKRKRTKISNNVLA